jgi:putative thioredoxin
MTITADNATFPHEVVERSHSLPVVVDFWAEWCGPCHQLAPVLDRVADRYAGDVVLVKVDVDACPELAGRYGVRGIPSVKAFRDGSVVAEFSGVRPEQDVEQFFAALAPSEADRLVDQASSSDAPEPLLRQALDHEPGNEAATLALAELLADRGEAGEALDLLEKVPQSDAARGLRSRLRLAEAGGQLEALRADVDGGDAEARVPLGRALAGREDYEEALEVLLAAVADVRTREEARHAVLEVFDVLGADHELVRRARPRLASALY